MKHYEKLARHTNSIVSQWRSGGRFCVGIAIALLLAQPLAAQLIDKRVTPLTTVDRQYMESQRQLVNELTLRAYGGRCCRRVSELPLLQRLLDDKRVSPEQTLELQAMGIVLGDLLASELGMHWVVYEDIQGRSRALQLDESDNFLFPVTMIARRHEGGDRTPVLEIYEQAYDAVEAARPPRPFE
jgi:hypothetical protein